MCFRFKFRLIFAFSLLSADLRHMQAMQVHGAWLPVHNATSDLRVTT
jgi:hypothetical protein